MFPLSALCSASLFQHPKAPLRLLLLLRLRLQSTPITPTFFSSLFCNSSRMASRSQETFPSQRQDTQPGKEHVMDPTPQAGSHDYKPANKLQGKVAVVTGGDSGIGRAVCLCFAQEGATVAFTYVKAQEDKDANDTLRMLRDIAKQRNCTKDKEAMAIPADLGFEENCKKVVDEVANAYGGQIDILVNNAAEQYVQTSIQDISEEQLDRVFRTNIFSYFFMAK